MPRNCLILGSGRSGTSLTAGLFAKAGYFMGNNLYDRDAGDGNPKGFFEDREINLINEDLLGPAIKAYRHRIGNKIFHRRRRTDLKLHKTQRWLATLPPSQPIESSPKLESRIKPLVAREPFCFKDPRFSYTLGVWRPLLRNTVFICVFRHPAITAASIIAECKRADYLKDVTMDAGRALRIWEHMYRYILDVHSPAGSEWRFVHYDQVMDGSALGSIEQALETRLDRGFADPKLRRSKPLQEAPFQTLTLYNRLCRLAGYDNESEV